MIVGIVLIWSAVASAARHRFSSVLSWQDPKRRRRCALPAHSKLISGKLSFRLSRLLIVLMVLPAALQTVHVLGSHPASTSANPQKAAIAAISAVSPSATPTPGASPSPTTAPVLLTEEDSFRAVAVDSVSFVRDPFPLLTDHNFSSDRRTRVMVFATNLNLATGEDMSVVTAQAEDQFQHIFPLTVEYVGRVSNVSEITQVNLRPPDDLAGGGDVWVNVSLRGVASNQVLISIKPQDINPTPAPRSGHALVYDAGRRAVLLLNGDHNAPAHQGEVWSWTGQRWLLIDTNGPAPRTLAAVAYDTGRRMLVMQGGLGTGTTVFGDTILWNGRLWQTAAGVGPGIRNHQAMVYDAARGKIVLFGGQDGNINLLGDTWEWDGSAWTRVATTGPGPRVHHAMVYDSVRHKVLLFGGSSVQGDLADFWEWDGSSWQQIPTQGTWPSPRAAHRMAFHAVQGVVYLVGGHQTDATVWLWNGVAWSRLVGATPSARVVHALAYDEARGRLVLFGGFKFTGQENLADTWELVDDRWLMVIPKP